MYIPYCRIMWGGWNRSGLACRASTEARSCSTAYTSRWRHRCRAWRHSSSTTERSATGLEVSTTDNHHPPYPSRLLYPSVIIFIIKRSCDKPPGRWSTYRQALVPQSNQNLPSHNRHLNYCAKQVVKLYCKFILINIIWFRCFHVLQIKTAKLIC